MATPKKLLPDPIYECGADTTDGTTRSFRLEASERAMARPHSRLAPMSIGGYGTEDGRRSERTMSGSVPFGRLALPAAFVLGVVALGALQVTGRASPHPKTAALHVKTAA